MLDFALMLWVKLLLADRIQPQSNMFATGVENEGVENEGVENEGVENEGVENEGVENEAAADSKRNDTLSVMLASSIKINYYYYSVEHVHSHGLGL